MNKDNFIPNDRTTVILPIGMDCRADPEDWCINVDERHERGCVRRYGAIPDPWIDHDLCQCHKGSK